MLNWWYIFGFGKSIILFFSVTKLLNTGYWDFIISSNFVVISERLSKPSIRVRHSVLDKEYCLFSLGCSSENSTISLYWESKNFNDTFWSCPQKGSSELVLWASFKPNREVTFDCIATADGHSESSSKSVKCIGMFTIFIKNLQLHLGINRLQ